MNGLPLTNEEIAKRIRRETGVAHNWIADGGGQKASYAFALGQLIGQLDALADELVGPEEEEGDKP